MFEQALSSLSTINQLELLIPTSILAVMLIAISKSGFGGGFSASGWCGSVVILLMSSHWVLPTWAIVPNQPSSGENGPPAIP